MRFVPLAAALMMLPLGGCLAKTAYNAATLPVRAGGKVVDWTTTSQAEADRNRGRKLRHEQARADRARRERERYCRKAPDGPACRVPSGGGSAPATG